MAEAEFDLIMSLILAEDDRERERVYKRLEKRGIDRLSANLIAAEFCNGCGGEGHGYDGQDS